jgi:DNA-binding beta-propeller fold protein YncE
MAGFQRLTERVARPVLYAAPILTLPAASIQAAQPTLGTAFPLYVADLDNNAIVKVANVFSSAIVKVDSSGNQIVFTSGQNLNGPYGLAFDSSGNLYVGSSNGPNNTIIKVDSGGSQSVFISGGDLYAPIDLVFDNTGD